MKKIFFVIFPLALSLSAESPEHIANRFRVENIQYVRFTFTDPLENKFRSIIRPMHYIEDDLQQGIKIDGSSIPGCARITESDMFLKPDLNAVSKKLPWTNEHMSTISIMCDLYTESGKPFAADPRVILRREIDAAYKKGYKFVVGPELEFYLLEKGAMTPIDSQCYFQSAQNWNLENAFSELLSILNYLELNVEKLHHEVAPGQYEMSFAADDALKLADTLVTTKNVLQSLCAQWQRNVTFMPKPFYGENGSGMHINFSLYDVKNQRNAFCQDDTSELSDIAKAFIAGVLKHVKEITLILNPSINSYKRLVPGYEAPIFICCGKKNRSSLIRIPEPTSLNTVRGELRSPDPLCNPYLAFAAILKAGMKGVEEGYSFSGCLSENLYTLNQQEILKRNIDVLPTSLEDAIFEFEHSEFARELLGDQLFNEILKAKKAELKSFNQAVTDWEIEHYC